MVYLALPDAQLARLVAMFNRPAAYVIGGVVAVVLGTYLSAIGFGLFV
jgi:hypothetical protein